MGRLYPADLLRDMLSTARAKRQIQSVKKLSILHKGTVRYVNVTNRMWSQRTVLVNDVVIPNRGSY